MSFNAVAVHVVQGVALTEIGTGIVFAIAGLRARRSVDEASVMRPRQRQRVAR